MRAALVLAAFGAAAGCSTAAPSSGPVLASTPTASAAPTPAGTPATGATMPLTGQPVATGSNPAAPAVAVVVTGGPGAPAPRGLDRADVIFQEFDNTSSDRFIAVYQSHDAGLVGPVGPTRPVDPQVLAVMHPLVGHSGGPRGFVLQLDAVPVVDLTAVTHASLYTVSGAPPYNLFTSLHGLRAAVTKTVPPPPPIFSFGGAGEALAQSGAAATSRITIHVPGQPAQTWVYDPRAAGWRRADAGGIRLTVANLVVQQVNYVTPKNPDVTVRSARIYGRGTCVALSRGQSAHCAWSKPGPKNLSDYADASGIPLRFAPGTTWVVLAPPGTTYQVSR